jgi:hypothetical protein
MRGLGHHVLLTSVHVTRYLKDNVYKKTTQLIKRIIADIPSGVVDNFQRRFKMTLDADGKVKLSLCLTN